MQVPLNLHFRSTSHRRNSSQLYFSAEQIVIMAGDTRAPVAPAAAGPGTKASSASMVSPSLPLHPPLTLPAPGIIIHAPKHTIGAPSFKAAHNPTPMNRGSLPSQGSKGTRNEGLGGAAGMASKGVKEVVSSSPSGGTGMASKGNQAAGAGATPGAPLPPGGRK
ncbi:hypothetical protein P171DRAFT_495614 [Karstenula rhodostoma CBS 690.94]|uniref:Uncharacterized protein n=1 Tax=Karstenula rhodostoma CBS 690.94 TaxID=1392251 RepID=A0A9P4PI39_9PLEO|nr:hypothetical protein P171DRAFT_495614 [Karstenula rhodostoma CBS 690.94]